MKTNSQLKFPRPSRRAVLYLGMIAAAFFSGGPSARAANAHLSAQDIKDLERVSEYLNRIKTLKAQFTQIDNWGGFAEGTVYMQRPNRARFEYQSPPNMPLLIADGEWMFVDDPKLKNLNHYPLSATPLTILLSDRVDLAHEQRIVAIDRAPGMLSITARDDKGVVQGELTLVFRDPGLELLNWATKDAQGRLTTIALRDVRDGISLSPSLFVPREVPKAPTRR